MKRPHPGELNGAQEVAHRDETVASALDDGGNRVRAAREMGKASSDWCCGGSRGFALMIESDGNLEVQTSWDPETMWSSDLGSVPKSVMLEAREKEVTKLEGSTHSRRFHRLRLRDTRLSVHGSWTSGKRLEN